MATGTAWKIKYFDGETAQAQAATARATSEGLRIESPSGLCLDIWEMSKIQFDPHHLDQRMIMVTYEKRARIEILEPGLVGDIPVLKKSFLENFLNSKKFVFVGLSFVVLFFVGAFLASRPLSRYLAFHMPELIKNRVVIEDYTPYFKFCYPRKSENNIFERLEQLYPEATKEWGGLERVGVIHLLQANAFALTNDWIVLSDELIEKAESYEEILGVLAHEKGHVRHKHLLQSLIQSSFLSLGVSFLTGDVSNYFAVNASLMTGLVSLKFDRDFETEADNAALDFLERHRISSLGLIQLLERKEAPAKQDPKSFLSSVSVPEFISSHPADAARVKRLRRQVLPGNLTPIEEKMKQVGCARL